MSTQLLDIHPCELKFTVEVRKQSSCAIQLVNISEHYVAFKVKTTSPKIYCVRPNTGIIKPKSKCDFTVVMLAQRSGPPDLPCKDKFLIQSTVVPFGTSEDYISPGMFAKDSGKHIEERKLKVVLISPPHSPVLLPANGVMKQESSRETSVQNEKQLRGIENLPPPLLTRGSKDVKVKDSELNLTEDVKASPVEDAKDTKMKLDKDIEELKSTLNAMELKLSEAGFTIKRLYEERGTINMEKEKLKRELAMLRKNGVRRVQVGFPFLYVCMVALISLTVGYILHA